MPNVNHGLLKVTYQGQTYDISLVTTFSHSKQPKQIICFLENICQQPGHRNKQYRASTYTQIGDIPCGRNYCSRCIISHLSPAYHTLHTNHKPVNTVGDIPCDRNDLSPAYHTEHTNHKPVNTVGDIPCDRNDLSPAHNTEYTHGINIYTFPVVEMTAPSDS